MSFDLPTRSCCVSSFSSPMMMKAADTTTTTTAAAAACSGMILRNSLRGSARNLGKNYSLAWKTGGGTHLTLVYMTNVKRGYEQHRVKRLVEEFLQEIGVPDQLPLTLGDEMATERCVSVTNGDILALQWAIHSFLEEKGFQVRPLRPPHIDLRGQSSTVLDDRVCTRNWNW